MMEFQKNQQTEQINPNNIPTQPNPDVTELTSDELEQVVGGVGLVRIAETDGEVGDVVETLSSETREFILEELIPTFENIRESFVLDL